MLFQGFCYRTQTKSDIVNLNCHFKANREGFLLLIFGLNNIYFSKLVQPVSPAIMYPQSTARHTCHWANGTPSTTLPQPGLTKAVLSYYQLLSGISIYHQLPSFINLSEKRAISTLGL